MERLVIFSSAFANKGEVNDRVAYKQTRLYWGPLQSNDELTMKNEQVFSLYRV